MIVNLIYRVKSFEAICMKTLKKVHKSTIKYVR